ncbi:MAG: hypothetical protein GDA41_00280 [Rhodospirillales bacterium]|nr:hypothetical protein [Rhodospirillales bacterium]
MKIRKLMNIWKAVAENKSFVHPLDKPLLPEPNDCFPLLRRVPEPWTGDPTKASIFHLTSHPRHGPNDGNQDEKDREFWWSTMASTADSKDWEDHTSEDELNWSKKNYGKFLEDPRFIPNLCNLRLVAYPCSSMRDMDSISKDAAHTLHTTKRMRAFVHRQLVPAAREGKCLLLVMKAPGDWGFANPEFGDSKEDRWDKGLFISRSGLQHSPITPGSRVGPAIQKWLDSLPA